MNPIKYRQELVEVSRKIILPLVMAVLNVQDEEADHAHLT